MTDEQRLRVFLRKTFARYDDDFGSADDLSGLIDSLALFDVLAFVESEFGVEVPTEDFHPQRFASIDRILEYVGELRAQ